MTPTFQPYREPFSSTLLRTTAIACVVGGVLAWRRGSLQAWPLASGLVFWFSFGGHWVEVGFLNALRPRLPRSRVLHVLARLAVWFLGGVGLGFGIVFTMRLFELTRELRAPPWWAPGLLFIAVEFIAHGVLALRHRPSFFNGEG